jgi:ATP-dependent DNA ligase
VRPTAILYAFELIELDGEDMRDCPFLDRKAALARATMTRTALQQWQRGGAEACKGTRITR